MNIYEAIEVLKTGEKVVFRNWVFKAHGVYTIDPSTGSYKLKKFLFIKKIDSKHCSFAYDHMDVNSFSLEEVMLDEWKIWEKDGDSNE